MNYYRQGDLGITPLKEIPQNLKSVYTGDNFVLAYGEATGHSHILACEPTNQFEILEDSGGKKYLRLSGNSQLIHQQHRTIIIEKGFYLINNEKEYDYFLKEIKQVQD
jgi:hypothetical protein